MHERRKDDPRLEQLSGEPFSDWDNPEDREEDAPEGYYDDETEDEDSYEPGPEDPDYDLSEAAGYADWDEPRNREPFPGWIVAAISIALLLAIVGGMLIRAT
jgi:hypothetical protein